MKITNTSASVITFPDLPAFSPGETRDVADDLGLQLLTRAEFSADKPHKDAVKETSKKSS